MNWRWRLRTRFGEEIAVVRDWHVTGKDADKRVPTLFVRFELRDWLLGPFGFERGQLLDMYREIRGVPMEVHSHSPADLQRYVLPVLEEAFKSGRLVALELRRPELPVALFPPEEAEPAPAADDDTLAPFELVLTSSTTGEPLVGVPLAIRTSAGEDKRLKTDAGGSIRLPALPPGSCEVTSIIVDARVDTSYVAKGGSAVAPGTTEDRQEDQGSKPPVHVVGVASHRVAAGDTPESIAKKWNTTWSEIALFNWGTEDPSELDERYREEVGCKKRTDDGQRYRFDDTDEPGIVLVPYPWRVHLEVGPTHRLSAEPLRPTFVSLENEFGLPLPGAEFRLRSTDGQERTGRLGRSGIARIAGLPEGGFGVTYPDQADLLARSFAASVRRAFDDQSTAPLLHLLGQSPDVIEKGKSPR